ncbi:MAG: hypothetical protein VW440_05100 [Bordetella sp.]
MDSPDLGYNPDLFVRPDDKVRLDRMVRAVTDEQLSIALISHSDALLDHYGRLFAEQLRRTSRLAVEIYSPDSTDALIDRFNRILASMSVSEALKTEGSMAPSRLLLVYDGRATGVREVQLLARLLKDFPGANTRVALLLHAHADAPKKVEAFGKRMVHWELSLPTATEKQDLLDRATAQGSLPEAQAFLALLGEESNASQALQETLSVLARADEALGLSPGSTQSELAKRTANKAAGKASVQDIPEAVSQAPSFSATMAPVRNAGANAKEEPRLSGTLDDEPAEALAADTRLPVTAPKKKFPAILVVGILALGASALLTLIQRLPEMGADTPAAPPAVIPQTPFAANPAAGSTPESAASSTPSTEGSPGQPLSSSDPAAAPLAGPAARANQAEATASPQAAAAPNTPTAAAPSARAGQRQFIVKGPIPERQETDPAVRLAPKTVNSAVSLESSTPPSVSPPAASTAAPASAAVRPAPVSPSVVRQAPAPAASAPTPPSGGVTRPDVLTGLSAGFYVQHIASPSRGNVEVFWRSRPALRQARLLELRRTPGSPKPNFVLVSGPFESMEQAQWFMAQPGLPRDMWLREASKIRPLLPNP